jgi:sensor c-di-GMP phosphodiesterase-like protein
MKDIEQILREGKPELPDEGAFLIETNARLSQVEGIKSEVDAQKHRWHKALFAALVAGIVVGTLITLLVVFYPAASLAASQSAIANAIETLKDYELFLLIPIAACAIALGVLSMNRKKEVL